MAPRRCLTRAGATSLDRFQAAEKHAMNEAFIACPDDAVLLELAEGRRAQGARDGLEEHLDCCTMCREVVAEIGRATSPAAVSSDAGMGTAGMLPTGARLGRYTLLNPLGSGGMGIVYAAHDDYLDRRVALKMLRRDLALRAPQVKARLLREAQAIARLAHPNVVTVYDVAVVDDDVVIAMELVTGGTLATLLHARGKTTRALLDLFVQAGQGLAAVHEAGIVHRDFKPDNVLVTENGRALVSDFGLARITASDPPSPPPALGDLGLVISRTGARVGTPAYMAPEQHAGLSTDARSDQFSFCVALHEALYGDRPFVGTTREELAEAMRLGAVRPAPRGSRVPTRVRRALLRGLAVDPAARHPTMAALLAALAPDRRGRATAAIAVLAAAVTAAVIVAFATARRPPDPVTMCRAAGAPIGSAWDGARADAIATRLGGLGVPYAIESWPPARAVLDAYAASWSTARVDACLATHVRGEQSPHLLDLRMRCLDRRLEALRSTVGLLEGADENVAMHVFEIATSLRPVTSCDARALDGPIEPPTDAATARLVDEAESQLGRARALSAAGKLPVALAAASAAVATADRAGFAPLRAQALLERGRLEDGNEDLKAAEASLYEAAWAAEACHADHVAALAWARLVSVIAYRQMRPGEAPQLTRQAEAAIARAGGDDEARVILLLALFGVARDNLRYDEAIARLEESRALVERLDGPEGSRMLDVLAGLADVYDARGDFEKGLTMAERALHLEEKLDGAQHPAVAQFLSTVWRLLGSLGRFEEARSLAEREVAIDAAAFGPTHLRVGKALVGLADIHRELGQCALALPILDRAVVILAPHGSAKMASLYASGVRGECLTDLGRSREGRIVLEAVRLGAQATAPSLASEFDPLLARALEGEGRLADACGVWKRAVGAQSSQRNPAIHAERLGGLGACFAKTGHVREGVALLEKARALRGELQGDPRQVAQVALDLAAALRTSGGDPARIRALATQARDVGRAAGIAGARLARSAEAFLAR
jgi:tetratricopeptide (TPR) repeat protein/tRNA A-37 threonylcarbamoyl transferase component Bud32